MSTTPQVRPTPAPTREPRCYCGQILVQTPGKRARRFCGEACRSAARRAPGASKRAAAAAAPTDEAGQSQPKTGRRLGTTGETATRAGQSVAEGGSVPRSSKAGAIRRDARYTLQEGLTRITRDKALKGCGRTAIAGAVGVVLNGSVGHLNGLATCGKIHLCPVCAAKIRAARSEEIDVVTAAWQADGGGLAMMTLTLRHYRRMRLGSLRKGERGGLVGIQHDAWISAFGHRAGKMWQQLKLAYGVIGYVRVWECTVGPDHGWHPHFHVLLFTGTPWTTEKAAEFEKAARERWNAAVQKAGGYRPNDKGCKVDVPKPEDTQQFSRYLMKSQDGKARFETWTPGDEMARADMKTGRKASRMPFEVAEGAVAAEVDDLELWWEYEYAAHGIRAMYWSNGLRKLLGQLVELDDRTDAQIAEEEIGGDPVAVIPAHTWYGSVIRHRGRRLDLIKAAERGGKAAVRALVASWGLEWGVDVLEPPKEPQSGSQGL